MVYSLLKKLQNMIVSDESKDVRVLNQGRQHLMNKQKKIEKLTKNLDLIENLTSQEAAQQSSQEKVVIRSLENRYNRLLSEYQTEYTTFMKNYNDSIKNLNDCKKTCQDITGQNVDKKKEACTAGCNIKGPYVSKCSDTYSSLRGNPEMKCGQMAIQKNICSINNGIGSILSGKESEARSSERADKNNITLEKGCCACGGGYGGKPYGTFENKKIYNCSKITDEQSKGYLKTACENATFNDSSTAQNLHTTYERLNNKNNSLIATANSLFLKVKNLRDIENTLRKQRLENDSTLQNNLNDFGYINTEIKNYNKNKMDTVKAQLEDVKLKEQSESLKYYIWTLLALSVFITIMFKMK